MTILHTAITKYRFLCYALCGYALFVLTACELDYVPEPSIYRFYELHEIERQIQVFHTTYPTLTSIHPLSPNTHEQRTIYSIKISDNAGIDEQEPAILMMSGVHAREFISVSTLYLITKHLLEQYATEKRIQDIINSYEIWIVLIANPDGYHYARTVDNTWRKNRRDNTDGTMGVDLNRNWDFQWDYTPNASYAAKITSTASDTYRGISAFSEPETQALKQLIEAITPTLFIDYHAFGQLVLYPYGHSRTQYANNTTISIGRSIARAISTVHNAPYTLQHGSTLYIYTGSSTDYVYDTYNIPSFVIELRPVLVPSPGLQGFYGFEHLVQVTFEENVEGFLTAIESVATHYP